MMDDPLITHICDGDNRSTLRPWTPVEHLLRWYRTNIEDAQREAEQELAAVDDLYASLGLHA